MKKIILFIFLFTLLFTFSCKKKSDTPDTNQDKEPINNSNTNQDKEPQNDPVTELDIQLSKDYYVIGETLEFSSSTTTIDKINISFETPNILRLLDNGSYRVQRSGNYPITFTCSELNLTKTIDLNFYKNNFEIDTTSDCILKDDVCEIRIYSFDSIYEDKIEDFVLSIDKPSLASIDGYNIIGKDFGDVTVTLTSKLNPLVKSSHVIKICNPETDFMIKPHNGEKELCVGETLAIDFTLDYDITDFKWQTSNKEVIRFTKYDTALEITGIGVGTTYISCYLKNNPSIKASYYLKVNGFKDVDYIDKLIKLAYGEVGTWEGKDEYGNYNNVQKYGEWYNNNGEPWCATFVSWCWYHAGLSNDLLVKYQGCTAGMQWAHEHGIFHDIKGDYYEKEDYNPKSGDIVIFLSDGGSHTGIVGYSDDTYIYTIEGNRSNRVDIWRIPKNQSKITGYISPKYPEVETRIDQSWLKNEMKDGKYLWTDVTTGLSTL